MITDYRLIAAILLLIMISSESFAYKSDEDGINNLRQRSADRLESAKRELDNRSGTPTFDRSGRWSGHQQEDSTGRVQQYDTGSRWTGSVGDRK